LLNHKSETKGCQGQKGECSEKLNDTLLITQISEGLHTLESFCNNLLNLE